MTNEEAISAVRKHPVAKVKVAVADIDGILRGKVMHRDKFLSVAKDGFGFCDVIFGWDAGDIIYDKDGFTGWHRGFPDAPARIDLSTCRNIPWDNDLPFFLADFTSEGAAAIPVCPRSLLKTVRQQAIDAGYSPVFSQEFEWFNFEETPQQLEQKDFHNIQPMTPGMFGYSILRSSQRSDYFNALFDQLGAFGVPLEGLHTETGPGVYEAAIQYGEILEAADRAVLFKTGVKEIAHRNGVMASFMAKWRDDLPGCSGHVHQSLWNSEQTQNLFHSDSDDQSMSDLMRHYIAGQLHCLPHILPMHAPTVNSYKRLVEGAWAPTTITWGIDNRTTALRALPGGEKSCRLENRVCGSDTNPYLTMAACLASGLYGIRHKLELKQPQTVGNGYEVNEFGTLPRNLHEATEAMNKSTVARELFGDGFVDHFVQTRDWEWREFSKSVTNWELKRYFEII